MRYMLLAAIGFLILSSAGAVAQGNNPFTLIAKYESDFNPTATDPRSTASGLYGFLNSTWQQDLAAIGGNPAQYPTARSAPASLQTAVAAQEISARGLSAWTCPSCDPPLVAALNASGGQGAYQLTGLSTDPASYASLDTGAGLQDFFGGGVATSTGPGGDTLSASGSGAPPQAALAPSASIFSFLYNEIINGALNNAKNMVASAVGGMWLPFLALLTLAVAVQGYRTFIGDFAMEDFLRFVVKAAIVAGLMAPGSSYFFEWIEEPLLNLPIWFARLFDSNSTLSLASPVGFFDSCAAGLYATALAVWHSSSWSFSMIPIGITIFFAYYIGYLALFLLFLSFLFGNFLVFIIVIIAPFIIPALLFRATTGYFVGWVNAAVTSLLVALLINVLLGLYFKLILDMVGSFSPSGSVHIDTPGFVGLVTGLLVLGITVAAVPRLARSISHGVTASFEGASKAMSGAMIVQHASGAGRAVGAATG